MALTVITHTSWFERLWKSALGVVCGVILIPTTAIMLFINEGKAVRTARALGDGARTVIEIDAAKVDPTHKGKLVHIAGAVSPTGTPEDTPLGIKAPGAVRLDRKVEMYQWRETSKSQTRNELGGGQVTVTTYDYDKTWSEEPIDSRRFKEPKGHHNPQFTSRSREFVVSSVKVGAFTLAGSSIAELGAIAPVTIDGQAARDIGIAMHADRPAILVGKTVFIGRNQASPDVGDLRIRFLRFDLQEVSAVGAQIDSGVRPWQAPNGNEVFLVKAGIVPAQELFADAFEANRTDTWTMRFAGLGLMFAAFLLVFRIFGVIADVIPFFGSIIHSGMFLTSLVLTAVLGSFAIAAGWLFYRPLVSLLLAASGFLIVYAMKWWAEREAKRTPDSRSSGLIPEQ